MKERGRPSDLHSTIKFSFRLKESRKIKERLGADFDQLLIICNELFYIDLLGFMFHLARKISGLPMMRNNIIAQNHNLQSSLRGMLNK